MKQTITMLLLLAGTFCAAGCSDDDNNQYVTNVDLQVSVTEADVAANGGSTEVTVNSTREWSAYTTTDWLSVSQKTAQAGETKLTITADVNSATTGREGTVVIKSGTERAYINVKQAAAEESKGDNPDIVAPEGYKLSWHDEFDGNKLNTADWTYETRPEVPTWNQELQTYVSDNDVVTVKNGILSINCKKVNDKVYSARIYAKRTTGWTYGYFEARIKLPKGRGTWPAFWMMPVADTPAWPDGGEIDIMEEVGYNANYVSSTVHCKKYNNTGTAIEHTEKYLEGAEGEFHVYGCEWTKDALTFYVDGVKTLTYKNDGSGNDAWPFYKPFYVILNLAWGGVWGGQKGVDEKALPASMEVDYVRVFTQK